MAAALAAISACDRDQPTPESNDRPDVRVVAHAPAVGQVVGREVGVRFRFDRYLRPSSVLRQSIYVTVGAIDPTTGESPAGGYFFEPRYDPYERTAVFALPPGDRLSPDIRHTVRLRPPVDPADPVGIRAFDGAPLADQLTYSFTTAAGVTDPEHDENDEWPEADWCDDRAAPPKLPSVRSVLAGCARAGCHAGAQPAAGMDLGSAASVRTTVLRVLAREALPTGTSGEVLTNPLVAGEGMPRVDPGNPGNSYLVYKLLINEANHPQTGDPEADEPSWQRGLPALEPADPAELARLRNAFVMLEPMPIGGRLTPNQMRSIVAWIGLGAEVKDCP